MYLPTVLCCYTKIAMLTNYENNFMNVNRRLHERSKDGLVLCIIVIHRINIYSGCSVLSVYIIIFTVSTYYF